MDRQGNMSGNAGAGGDMSEGRHSETLTPMVPLAYTPPHPIVVHRSRRQIPKKFLKMLQPEHGDRHLPDDDELSHAAPSPRKVTL